MIAIIFTAGLLFREEPAQAIRGRGDGVLAKDGHAERFDTSK
jgi:hypothetical protein